ncbi:MAG: NAD(P)-binding protein [Anaerolineaceae bacterium]|nr:NAD(P)-binding protein [Anaerolineaceae bacterium]
MPLPIPEHSPLLSTETSQPPAKKKIAILGGGVAAVSTAFELTNHEDWHEYYDITLYQMGWRLGGKGASGRNQSRADRIEEHGLHVWSGSYENAFTLLRQCYQSYEALQPSPGMRHRTWEQAFSPQNEIYLIEEIEPGKWQPWAFHIPNFAGEPGNLDETDDYNQVKTFTELLLMFLDYIQDRAEARFEPEPEIEPETSTFLRNHNLWFDSLADWLSDIPETLSSYGATLIQVIKKAVANLTDELLSNTSGAIRILLERLRSILRGLFEKGTISQHQWVLIDYGLTIACGILADDLMSKPFDSISHLKFDDWLIQHGLSDETLKSPFLSAMYDLVFAFPGGQIGVEGRDVDAATMLKVNLRVSLRNRGAPLWRMNSGMGDIVFEPLYAVLKSRGVKFKFFHEVTSLGLSPDKKSIQNINIGIQATPKKHPYNPLIKVNGFWCWPNKPVYERLKEGEALKANKIDLEIPRYPRWHFQKEITLKAGKDFDIVILGIPIAALKDLCQELIAASPAWENMVNHVQTIPTQSAQLWLRPNLHDLGWEELVKRRYPDTPTPLALPMVGNIPHTQLDTWVAMDQVLPEESWKPDEVGTLAYFTGIMDPASPTDPEASREIVKDNMLRLLNQIKPLWLFANQIDGDNKLDWNLLAAPDSLQGQSRFDYQYFRANVAPSERYTLSVTGSKQFRLRGDQSQFERLYLVGDWTNNGLNLGMVEAAVMSALQVSKALIGMPLEISGEDDFF